MKYNHLLSIITITKNDGPGLQSTLRSIKGICKIHGVENIIIDGDPESLSIVSTPTSTQVRVVFQAGIGISNAFNQGISISKGQWLWFLNGGDTMLNIDPKFLLSYLKNTSADILIFDYIHGSKAITKPPIYALWPPSYNWIPHPATIIRSSVFKKYGVFEESFKVAMDGELWMRLLSKPDIRVDLVGIPLTHFDTTGISSRSPLRAKESLQILWKYKTTIVRRWVNSLYLTFRALADYIKQSK